MRQTKLEASDPALDKGKERAVKYNVTFLALSAVIAAVLSHLAVTPASSQSANDGFDPNVNGPVRAIGLQADGKVVIGGSFTTVGGVPRTNIARLNVDGSPDVTFVPDAASSQPGGILGVLCVAVQTDGKILLGGTFTTVGGYARTNIVRLNPDGNVDDGFSPSLNGTVWSIVVQPDGKILVAGDFYQLDGEPVSQVTRLNSDGSRDSSFASEPVFGANDFARVYDMAIQRDGRIVAVGNFFSLNFEDGHGLLRLNPDGSPDHTFRAGANSEVYNVRIQADGKIVVGGLFTHLGDLPSRGIGRFNPDGSVDRSFNNPGANGTVSRLEIQPDGKILVGGNFTALAGQSRTNLARLNPDGSLDSAYQSVAVSQIFALALQPDCKALIGGSFMAFGGAIIDYLGRVYGDGSIEKTFGPQLNAPHIESVADVYTAIPLSDGKVIVGGNFAANDQGVSRTNLARFFANGQMDLSFDAGLQAYYSEGFIFPLIAVALLDDGGLLVHDTVPATGAGFPSRLYRLHQNGSLNTNFTPKISGRLSSWKLQPDGRLLVASTLTNSTGIVYWNLARLHPDGTSDHPSLAQANSNLFVGAIQADGQLLVGGRFTEINGQPRHYMARLNPDGAVDQSFRAPTNDPVRSLSLQADGRILMTVETQKINGVARSPITRLNADGNIDTNFSPPHPSLWSGASQATASLVHSMRLTAEGRILLSGVFQVSPELGPTVRTNLVRLSPNGNLELDFRPGPNEFVRGIGVQFDGKILLNGFLGAYGSRYVGRTITGLPAVQRLLLAEDNVIRWERGGSAPEVEYAGFEWSMDGSNYVNLGFGVRVSGGWEFKAASLPTGENFFVRACGRAVAGYENLSSTIVDSVAQFWRLPRPFLSNVQILGGGKFQFSFTNTNAAAFSVLASTNAAAPAASWEKLGTPLSVGGGVYQFTDSGATNHARRFYQLRSP